MTQTKQAEALMAPPPSGDGVTSPTSETFAQTKEMVDLVRELTHQRDLGKMCYMRCDEVLGRLIQLVPVGAAVLLPNGQVFEMIDNFSKGNTAFKATGVKQFDIVERKPPKAKKAD